LISILISVSHTQYSVILSKAMAFGPMTDFCADIQVPDCLNDIIAKVEQRDYRNKQEQIVRLIRHNKNLRKKASKTADEWEAATAKIGQENCHLHKELKAYKSDARNQGQININREKEIKLLKRQYETQLHLRDKLEKVNENQLFDLRKAEDALDEQMEKNEDLEAEIGTQHELIEGLSGVCRDDFDDIEEYVDDVNQQIRDDQKQREREIDDLEEEIRNLKLEVKAAQEVTMAYMKRFDKLAEKKVERACSRIKCDDKFGHLIGRIPTDK